MIDIFMPAGDPVCGTCRKKCRRCDRTRPHCTRCVSKGLVCEGYSTTFKIYNGQTKSSSTQKARQRRIQVPQRNEELPAISSPEENVNLADSPISFGESFDTSLKAYANSPPDLTDLPSSSLPEVRRLLAHCKYPAHPQRGVELSFPLNTTR